MKAELNINDTADVKHTFPALYQAINVDGRDIDGFVVLAINATTACRLSQEGDMVYTGYKGWAEFVNPEYWRRLPAGTTVTLTQE